MSDTVSRETLCFGCGSPRDRPGQRYCRSCHAAYMRRWRAAGHERLSPEARKRAVARAIANVALARGKLTRQPYAHCAGPGEEKHHHDYDKPLEVTWLCVDCHYALHGRTRHAA